MIVIAFYVFSNIMINAFLKVSYVDMHDYEINVDQVFIDVSEAKTSKRNGYIKLSDRYSITSILSMDR